MSLSGSLAAICSGVIVTPSATAGRVPGFVIDGARFVFVVGQLNTALAVPPLPSLTVTVTLLAAAASKPTVPLIAPVPAPIARPLGRPVAL